MRNEKKKGEEKAAGSVAVRFEPVAAGLQAVRTERGKRTLRPFIVDGRT